MSSNANKKAGRVRTVLGVAAAATLLLAVPGTASASTFSNAYSGSDETWGGVTTLNYSAGHAAFTLRLGVDGWAAEDQYSISMFDRYGNRVWSASGRGSTNWVTGKGIPQNYSIGSNVTRISIDPNSGWSVVSWARG